MKPRDWVALILTVGVVIILLTGTNLRYLLTDEPPVYHKDAVQAWKDIILVIIGALSGYIAGKTNGND